MSTTLVYYLIFLTSQLVCSKLITISTTTGSDSNKCCVQGECPCSSPSKALHHVINSTFINITSESVPLNNKVTIGSGIVTNITIRGNGATILCGNNGSVECDKCSDVIMEGITWDKCGRGNTFVAAILFRSVSNIKITECVFQHSLVVALGLFGVNWECNS